MHCFGVTILCVLNQKYHQKRDHRRRRVDDQLPGIGKVKSGPCNDPYTNDKHSCSERPGAAKHRGRTLRENTKCVTDHTKEIAFLFVLFELFDLGFLHSLTITSRRMRTTRAQDRESTTGLA